mmetsp:Transcript_43417/g.100673  ORF Transcript_43417/g.100673 Transcript_43417/m.100673 type:complete len:184 (-) Transcript_43417:52-603(-)
MDRAINVGLTAVIIGWQALTVSYHSKSFPSTLWTGETNEVLNEACARVFFVMRWTVLLTFFIIVAKLFIALMQGIQACLPCMTILAIMDIIAEIAKQLFFFWGLYVVLTTDEKQVQAQCPDLWTCAWWSFLGFLLLSLVFACCFVCCAVPAMAAKAGQEGGGPNETTPLNPDAPPHKQGAAAV